MKHSWKKKIISEKYLLPMETFTNAPAVLISNIKLLTGIEF